MDAALVSRGWPIWARYACASLIVALAAVLRFVIFESLRGYPFLLFYPAIISAGLLFDRGTGIFSCLLSAAIATLFIEPVMEPWVGRQEDWIALVLFLATGVLIAVLMEALHVAFIEVSQAHEETHKLAAQRSVLLRELGHRVQNDLANMAYIISAEARIQDNPKAQSALELAARRLRILGRVHRRLQISADSVTLDAKDYIEGLCGDLRHSLLSGHPVELTTAVEAHQLSIARAVPLGLIINELVTNAIKHAFPDGRAGKITVGFSTENGAFCLRVGDDGVGTTGSLPSGQGLSLLSVLAEQLGGHILQMPGEGTQHVVRFSKTANE